jgi:cytochrome c556
MKKRLVALALLAVGFPLAAAAQFSKSEDAITYRQSAMFIMNQHLGRIGAMVNDKAPFDAAQAKASADIVKVVGALPWAAFGPGTEKGAETRARPEIWSDPGKFSSAQDRLQALLPKLAAAAETGDKSELKKVFGETGAACKNCHDTFRSK